MSFVSSSSRRWRGSAPAGRSGAPARAPCEGAGARRAAPRGRSRGRRARRAPGPMPAGRAPAPPSPGPGRDERLEVGPPTGARQHGAPCRPQRPRRLVAQRQAARPPAPPRGPGRGAAGSAPRARAGRAPGRPRPRPIGRTGRIGIGRGPRVSSSRRMRSSIPASASQLRDVRVVLDAVRECGAAGRACGACTRCGPAPGAGRPRSPPAP